MRRPHADALDPHQLRGHVAAAQLVKAIQLQLARQHALGQGAQVADLRLGDAPLPRDSGSGSSSLRISCGVGVLPPKPLRQAPRSIARVASIDACSLAIERTSAP